MGKLKFWQIIPMFIVLFAKTFWDWLWGKKKTKLSKERLKKYAETHKPPQSWYNEDITGL